MIQRRVFVSGRVQGVGFRASALAQASCFSSISGYVRNLPDGRVEVLFRGSEEEVLKMVSWCEKGPKSARVSQLEVIEESVEISSASDHFKVL